MGVTFRSATVSELRRGGPLDLSGWAGMWRTATSLLDRLLDGVARLSEPYYADVARTGGLLERAPPERRMEAALEWHSRSGRIA